LREPSFEFVACNLYMINSDCERESQHTSNLVLYDQKSLTNTLKKRIDVRAVKFVYFYILFQIEKLNTQKRAFLFAELSIERNKF
jgi:hypothetical protein